MRVPAVLAAALLVLAGGRGVGAEPSTVEREIRVGGVPRSYLIHVPPGWDRKRPLPVLFVFHGAGSDAESMVKATGFDALADATPDAQMLVVYPRAPARVKRYEVDPPAGRESADVLLVDALLERLRARFPIDERRICATGFSNGAALCYRLAAERPHVFAAIAPVAGYLPNLVRTAPIEPVPVFHVHGTADGRVGSPTLDVPTSAVRTWAGWNGAASGPVETRFADSSGLVLRHQVFTGPNLRSDAHLLLVEGAGHEWSGGPGGVVTQFILQFLAMHPRPGPGEALVGQPFGPFEGLRWVLPVGRPFSLAAQPFTLFHWWSQQPPRLTEPAELMEFMGPVLVVSAAQHFRARGLQTVIVLPPPSGATGRLVPPPFAGALAVDERRVKYFDLKQRGNLPESTDVSVLVDSQGVVRWVGAGGFGDFIQLQGLLNRLLPPAATPAQTPPR